MTTLHKILISLFVLLLFFVTVSINLTFLGAIITGKEAILGYYPQIIPAGLSEFWTILLSIIISVSLLGLGSVASWRWIILSSDYLAGGSYSWWDGILRLLMCLSIGLIFAPIGYPNQNPKVIPSLVFPLSDCGNPVSKNDVAYYSVTANSSVKDEIRTGSEFTVNLTSRISDQPPGDTNICVVVNTNEAGQHQTYTDQIELGDTKLYSGEPGGNGTVTSQLPSETVRSWSLAAGNEGNTDHQLDFHIRLYDSNGSGRFQGFLPVSVHIVENIEPLTQANRIISTITAFVSLLTVTFGLFRLGQTPRRGGALLTSRDE